MPSENIIPDSSRWLTIAVC